MPEQEFNTAKSSLAFSQTLTDRLRQSMPLNSGSTGVSQYDDSSEGLFQKARSGLSFSQGLLDRVQKSIPIRQISTPQDVNYAPSPAQFATSEEGRRFGEDVIGGIKSQLTWNLEGLEQLSQAVTPQVLQEKGITVDPFFGVGALKETPKIFKGAKDLTTKFLEYTKGKTTLSRQEIADFTRRPELKKGEADLLLRKLEEFEPKGAVKELEPFAQEARKIAAKGGTAEEFAKSLKTSNEFGFVGEKEILVDLPIKNIRGRLLRMEEFRDIAGRGGLPSPGRKITKPILVRVENLSDIGNTKVDIADGHQRLRQAIANKQDTIPARIFLPENAPQLTDFYKQAVRGTGKLPVQEFADTIRREIQGGGSKIMELTKEQLRGKSHRDFPQGSILKIGKYRIHIDGLKTYAEHDNNPMIKLKEFDMPEYIRDIVF